MNLVPPTHGRAEVRWIVAQEEIAAVGEEAVRERMLDEMNRLYQEEFGADVPEAWLTWTVSHSEDGLRTEVLLTAEAPTRSQTYFDALRSVVRTVQIALTPDSSIPIVANPYVYGIDNPYRRTDHVLTFAGWDAETGLMVFDR